MGAALLAEAPALSTPDTHILEEKADFQTQSTLSDEQLLLTYEVERTAEDICAGRWERIALQFPDHLLVDAPRVFEALVQTLRNNRNRSLDDAQPVHENKEIDPDTIAQELGQSKLQDVRPAEEKLFILGDTSYGSCCVDEIAAAHVDADVVVHYGRSCLSPTARLPVVYVFTVRPLEIQSVCEAFRGAYSDPREKVILMADIPYISHIPETMLRLQDMGYTDVFATSVLHDPSSPIPNRTVPEAASKDITALRQYQVFHVSEPPTSLLLTLASRVGSVSIYPTDSSENASRSRLITSSTAILRRRYALVASLSSAAVFGILVNTLSVKNYLHIVDHVKAQIAAAGKKCYTFVVGKINAAKVANFSEIDGWIIIGCWESSLIESRDFWKPIITPFELELALKGDASRVWTGDWTSDFQAVLQSPKEQGELQSVNPEVQVDTVPKDGDVDSEEESQPPEFDLRTGRYVSHSHPLQDTSEKSSRAVNGHANGNAGSTAQLSLVRRPGGDVARVGGVLSPGAEYLRSRRTWQGLGSDFADPGASNHDNGSASTIEEGRSGIARGYTHGDDKTIS